VAGLAVLGWTDSANVRIDVRSGAGEVSLMQRFAKSSSIFTLT
jgi:hypothetical protein